MASAKLHMSHSVSLIFWELLLLLVPSSVIAISELNNCFPGEESTSRNFTCDLENKPDANILWKKDNLTISYCIIGANVECTDNYPVLYKATWNNGTGFLTIQNISIKSNGFYSCVTSIVEEKKTCNFKIYAKPENITCQVAKVGEDVMYTCEIKRVYPEPKCKFIQTTNDTIVTKKIQNSDTATNISGYYTSNCSLTLPAEELGLGIHQMTVTVFPSFTGNDTSDLVYGKNFSLTSSVNISWPTIMLNCPTDFVLENLNYSCTCIETSNSFILVKTSFYDGTVLKSQGYRTVEYTFTAKRNMPAITCSATLFNTSSYKNYVARVAYGPSDDAVKLTHNHMEQNLDVCDRNKPFNVTVNCTVPNTSFSPGIYFYISVNNTIIASNTSYYSFEISAGGVTFISCTGLNSAFPNISGKKESYLKSSEPPHISPLMQMIQANSDINFKLKEGTASITCKAEGGYPPVSNVTTECGSQKNISQGNVGYLNLQIYREMDGSNCTCTGNHVSSCTWNNTASSKLDVYFDPRVTALKVNGKEGNYNVKINSNVSFSCLSEGNPSPIVSLIKSNIQIINTSDNVKKFNVSLLFTKNMTDCKDTGIYICRAGSSYKNVTVSVNCSQQLANPSQQLSYSAYIQDQIEITIDVYGYPEPYRFSLTGSNFDINEDKYKAYYEEKEPPYGTVSLTIFTKSQKTFQNYTLYIYNGEGSLPFKFQILDKGDKNTDMGVAAIVGGVVAGVVVVAVITVIIILLKRKGRFLKRKENTPGNRIILETQQGENQDDGHYANIPHLNIQQMTDSQSPSHYDEVSHFQIIGQKDTYMNVNLELFPKKDTANHDYENMVPSF